LNIPHLGHFEGELYLSHWKEATLLLLGLHEVYQYRDGISWERLCTLTDAKIGALCQGFGVCARKAPGWSKLQLLSKVSHRQC
jgi:hypothetical protein